MKIRILKETPFDNKGAELSMAEFRSKYRYVCNSDVTDAELFNYIHSYKSHPKLISKKNDCISDWFEAVHEPELAAIINGVIYSKQFDGNYHMFLSGSALIPDNSIGSISCREFDLRVEKAKYSVSVPYYYSHPNCKVQ